ncbi:hypothetical protein L8106_09546 [Lyngbya sp. PCC 8106]|nr:hypothetical protein L8106_09546 [Lyngbya sp. PCC 8106]
MKEQLKITLTFGIILTILFPVLGLEGSSLDYWAESILLA